MLELKQSESKSFRINSDIIYSKCIHGRGTKRSENELIRMRVRCFGGGENG